MLKGWTPVAPEWEGNSDCTNWLQRCGNNSVHSGRIWSHSSPFRCSGICPPADGGMLRNPVKLCRNSPSILRNVTVQRGFFSTFWTRGKINQFVIHKGLSFSFQGISFKLRLYDRNNIFTLTSKRPCVKKKKSLNGFGNSMQISMGKKRVGLVLLLS